MSKVITDLLKQGRSELSFLTKALTPNLTWAGLLLGLVAMVVFVTLEADVFLAAAAREPEYAKAGRLIIDHYLAMLTAPALLFGAYLHGMGHLTGSARTFVRKAGIYKARDYKFAASAAQTLGFLLSIGASKTEALLLLREVNRTDKYRAGALDEAIARTNGGMALNMSLNDTVLLDKHAGMLYGFTPSDSSDEYVRCLPIIVSVAEEDIRSHLTTCRTVIATTLLAPSAYLLKVLLPVLTGAMFQA